MEIQRLTVSERITLAEALWDSVANQDDKIELTESQKQELELRLLNYKIDQNTGSSWKDVKRRILSDK